MKISIRPKKVKLIIAGFIIIGILGYLLFTGTLDNQVYYLTPSEIINLKDEITGSNMRLGGIVKDGSIEWDAKNLILEFEVIDAENSIQVTYKGVIPDSFQNGVEVVIEGSYVADRKFNAVAIFPKCASKYEPA